MKIRPKLLNERWRCRVTLGMGWPRMLALGATVAVVLLAVAPGGLVGGEYDPVLAVLTATVVAAIWAGYWAFRAVHPPAAVKVDLGVETGKGPEGYTLSLRPRVRNPTLRTIEARVHLGVWLLETEELGRPQRPRRIDLTAFYRGEHPKHLAPNDGFTSNLDLTQHLWIDDDPHSLWEMPKALAQFRVAWTDDLCEEGEIEPKYWHIEVGGVVSAVVDPERVTALFEDLP